MQTNESEQLQMTSEDVEDVEFVGDYSSNMDEILGEGPNDTANGDDDDEDIFVYEGADTEPAAAYRDQLRDVLGAEHEDDELEQSQFNATFQTEIAESPSISPRVIASEDMPSSSTHSEQGSPHVHPSPLDDRSPQLSPAGIPLKLSRPYLHPSISRLRSYPAQPTSPTNNASPGQAAVMASPSPSYFSELSGQSSLADLAQLGISASGIQDEDSSREQEAFRWTRLRQIENAIGLHTTPNPNIIKGADDLGTPSCMTANGLICLGTSTGRVLVYNFKQMLQCVCGNDAIVKAAGAVTAIALSHDHTFVASGHASGYILVYDLKRSANPVRTVPPTSMSKVRTGRKEGHISGSRIVNIGFIATRHTALASADDHGLAFYHSLGKVLFVEASDTLRILGKYPDEESVAVQKSLPGSINTQQNRRRQQTANAILALSPLPLGGTTHTTDQYQVIAVLTPVKLVVVGLKPTPKTWYRRHRGASEGGAASNVRWKGCLAWCPAISDTPAHHSNGKSTPSPDLDPILAYSWADSIHILRVTTSTIKKTVQNPRNGDVREVQDGILDFTTHGSWRASGLVIGIQWLNHNQLLVVTPATIEVYDTHTQQMLERSGFNATALVTPRLIHERNSHFEYAGNVGDVAHSIRVHKGKIFLLGQDFLQVGTMLTWADRILRYVENGDFLKAIELARLYYTGEAPGNRNGLPTSITQLQAEVGRKMSDLMTASARYAFSEDRLTDTTHQAVDGRGVDRTSLFEGLVSTCARACITLEDYDFLFEELYQHYEDWGITSIYLRQLEGFIIGGSMHSVPPRITQRLITMLEEEGATARVEEVIWHVDPLSLDINQAIRICERFYLYDALVYVYTKALADYVAPIVKFLSLIRTAQQYRKAQESGHMTSYDDASIEPFFHHGYKIFAYLANVLSGLSHPSQDALDESEAEQARNAIYSFLFFGRSTTWPSDGGGKLVLTADVEGGAEPTYPYLRLLLNFDTEAFLHALDIAFEDAYFIDRSGPMNRLIIVKILLDVLTSSKMSEDDRVLINIFIARNVPKYSQSIELSISEQQQILLDLASLGNDEDRDDRQLAAEYLLSAYTPHQTRQLIELFEKANFFRILRRWYRQERQWPALLSTYTQDLSLPTSDMFLGVEQTLAAALKAAKGRLSSDVEATLEASLAVLLQSDASRTAALVNKFAPHLHDTAVESPSLESDRWRLEYLRCLLDRPGNTSTVSKERDLPKMSQSLQYRLLDLQCQYEPAFVKDTLEALSRESLDWQHAMGICEQRGVFDVVVWGCSEDSGAQAALSKAENFQRQLTSQLIDTIRANDELSSTNLSDTLQKVTQAGLEVCIGTMGQGEAEDMWFRFLNAQIQTIQNIATRSSSIPKQDLSNDILSSLRSTFHESFTVLMTANALGLPPIFKRLVEAATKLPTVKSTAYTEFRTILSGLLDAYGSDEDNATITAHLVDRDLFDVMEEREIVRRSGWHSLNHQCSACRTTLIGSSGEPIKGSVVITRTGLVYHAGCVPES